MVLGTWSLFTLVYDIINRNLEESKYGVELQYIHIVWTNIDIDMTDTLPWVYVRSAKNPDSISDRAQQNWI